MATKPATSMIYRNDFTGDGFEADFPELPNVEMDESDDDDILNDLATAQPPPKQEQRASPQKPVAAAAPVVVVKEPSLPPSPQPQPIISKEPTPASTPSVAPPPITANHDDVDESFDDNNDNNYDDSMMDDGSMYDQEGEEDVDDCKLAHAIIDMSLVMGLNIAQKKEWFLLVIAHQALKDPLLPGWSRQIDQEDGSVIYVNDISAKFVRFKPYDVSHYEKLIAKARLYHSINNIQVSPWLKLTEQDLSTYYYNFETNRRSDEPPIAMSEAPEKVLDSDQQKKIRDKLAIAQKIKLGLTLEKMQFTSWWTENRVRHFFHVEYNLLTEDFRVRIDKDESVYVIKQIEGRNGPIDCWDLHVKAQITVLGRHVTLMQASYATSKWLCAQASRLLAIKKDLASKLSKYEVVTTKALNNVPLFEINLRHLKQDCAKLTARLLVYRPNHKKYVC